MRKQVRRTVVGDKPGIGDRGSSGVGNLGRANGTGRLSFVGTICVGTLGVGSLGRMNGTGRSSFVGTMCDMALIARSDKGDVLLLRVVGLVMLIKGDGRVEDCGGV